MAASKQLVEIRKVLLATATESTIASHKKFVPGVSTLYGVSMPVLNTLAADFKQAGIELVEELGKSDFTEEKILAAKLLGKCAKKDPVRALNLFKKLADNIDNWAECDTLGMQALKPLVSSHTKEIFTLADRYNRSSNPWLRRLSLVMVEWYTRDKNFHPAIKKLIKALEGDEEYYVKTAILWINKNFAKGK